MSAVVAITALSSGPVITQLAMPQTAPVPRGAGFGDILSAGLRNVETKLSTADDLVQKFALDDSSVPVHQVTYALEEARMSVELAMQVRTRLVEGYRELMNMQL